MFGLLLFLPIVVSSGVFFVSGSYLLLIVVGICVSVVVDCGFLFLFFPTA